MDKKKKIIVTLVLILIGWLVIWIPITAFILPFPIVKEKVQSTPPNVTLNVNNNENNK